MNGGDFPLSIKTEGTDGNAGRDLDEKMILDDQGKHAMVERDDNGVVQMVLSRRDLHIIALSTSVVKLRTH